MSEKNINTNHEWPPVGMVRNVHHWEITPDGTHPYTEVPIPGTPEELPDPYASETENTDRAFATWPTPEKPEQHDDEGMSRRAILMSMGAIVGGGIALALESRYPGLNPFSSETNTDTSEVEAETPWEHTIEDGQFVWDVISDKYQDADNAEIGKIVYEHVTVRRKDNSTDNNVDNVHGGDVIIVDYPEPETPTPEVDAGSDNE